MQRYASLNDTFLTCRIQLWNFFSFKKASNPSNNISSHAPNKASSNGGFQSSDCFCLFLSNSNVLKMHLIFEIRIPYYDEENKLKWIYNIIPFPDQEMDFLEKIDIFPTFFFKFSIISQKPWIFLVVQ